MIHHYLYDMPIISPSIDTANKKKREIKILYDYYILTIVPSIQRMDVVKNV